MKLTDVKYRPEGPYSIRNRLYHAMEAGTGENTDAVLLDTGGFLFITEDRLQVTNNEGEDRVLLFEDLPEFDLEPVYEVREAPDSDDRFQHIRAYGSDQTGGMVMVDWLEHKAGLLISVSDECVIVFKTTYGYYYACEQDYFHLERGFWFHDLSLDL